jgi:tetratricopeptide (TPR) repeat protein
MADSSAIRMISDLMSVPGGGDVADIIEQYPYFIPARYIRAAAAHKESPYAAAMLGDMHAYTGNWLLFLDHLEGKHVAQQAPVETVVAEEVITPELQQEMAGNMAEDRAQDAETILEAVIVTEPVIEAVAEEVTEEITEEVIKDKLEDIFTPIQSDDYFMQQGIKVSQELPEHIDASLGSSDDDDNTDKSLMVMMSFTEWLVHFKRTSDRKNSEIEDQKAVRAMWQKEKLAAALEEENDEIPENVFEMAVNSIAKEEGLASESLAEIYLKQGKYDQAIEMYKKLSLRNPQKNAYFAARIEEIIKGK